MENAEWAEIQDTIRGRVVAEDTQCLDDIDLVGGIDISYSTKSSGVAVACAVVFSVAQWKIVYSKCVVETVAVPYRPGFLAFREVAPMLRLHAIVASDAPALLPQVWIVDGNGVMHCRGAGLASHFGVAIDAPAIGVAKTAPANFERGDALPGGGHALRIGGAVVGAEIPGGASTRPVYVSVGHRVSLATAIRVVRACSQFRVPEPTRHADILSRQALRERGL